MNPNLTFCEICQIEFDIGEIVMAKSDLDFSRKTNLIHKVCLNQHTKLNKRDYDENDYAYSRIVKDVLPKESGSEVVFGDPVPVNGKTIMGLRRSIAISIGVAVVILMIIVTTIVAVTASKGGDVEVPPLPTPVPGPGLPGPPPEDPYPSC